MAAWDIQPVALRRSRKGENEESTVVDNVSNKKVAPSGYFVSKSLLGNKCSHSILFRRSPFLLCNEHLQINHTNDRDISL